MKKTGKLLVFLLCAVMLLSLLAACGGDKGGDAQEPDDEPLDWDSGPDTAELSAAENTKELDIGTRYDAGFVMDLPEGFHYDEGWCCYQNDKVQAWIGDADFYEHDHNLEDVLENANVSGPGEPLGPFTYWTREAEEFYGPSTHYYISFNGLYPEWAGCHVLISSLNSNVADTNTPEFVEAMKTIRRKGEAVGEQGGGAAAAQPSQQPDEPTPEPTPETLSSPFEDLFLVYDGAQAGKMSAFMNYGRYACSGNQLVGLGFSDNENILVRMDLKRNGAFADVDSYEILDTCEPSYVCIYDDTVYYIRDWGGICRVPIGGGQPECVVVGPADYLQICGDDLYYCDSDYRFHRAGLDGRGDEILFDQEIYYPYMLDEEWLVYQNDADNESLHIRHIPTGADAAITDAPSYGQILYGSDLYAVCFDGDKRMIKVDLINPTVEFDEASGDYAVSFNVEYGDEPVYADIAISSDGYVYFGRNYGVYIDNWKDAANESGEYDEVYMFSNEDYGVYWEKEDGLITGIYVSVFETGGAQSIPQFS